MKILWVGVKSAWVRRKRRRRRRREGADGGYKRVCLGEEIRRAGSGRRMWADEHGRTRK